MDFNSSIVVLTIKLLEIDEYAIIFMSCNLDGMKNMLRELNNHKYLILVLFFAVCFSVLFIELYEIENIWGDEPKYIEVSHLEASTQISPVTSLLPGFLRFEWWPPLPYSIYSFFTTEKLQDHFAELNTLKGEDFKVERRRFIKNLAYFNIFLLVLSGVLVYLIGMKLSLSSTFAALGVGLTLLNPRVVFYITTLWPELIHYVLLLSAIYFLISYFERNSLAFLLISSLLFVYCVFTKLIIGYYFYLLILVLVYYHRHALKQKRTIYALCLFILPFFMLSAIQQGANYYRYNIYAISTNGWINIEKGITPRRIMNEAGTSVSILYKEASDDPVVRERKSKERVIEYVTQSSTLIEFVSHQTSQFLSQLGLSYIWKGVSENRWTHSNNLGMVVSVSKLLSWFLFMFGSVGAVLYARKNIITFTVALFVIYYAAALFIVFYNARYFVPLIPFLAIFTSMALRDLIIASRNEPSV